MYRAGEGGKLKATTNYKLLESSCSNSSD